MWRAAVYCTDSDFVSFECMTDKSDKAPRYSRYAPPASLLLAFALFGGVLNREEKETAALYPYDDPAAQGPAGGCCAAAVSCHPPISLSEASQQPCSSLATSPPSQHSVVYSLIHNEHIDEASPLNEVATQATHSPLSIQYILLPHHSSPQRARLSPPTSPSSSATRRACPS